MKIDMLCSKANFLFGLMQKRLETGNRQIDELNKNNNLFSNLELSWNPRLVLSGRIRVIRL